MQRMNIDVETRSSVNLKTDGVYRYVESDDFEIMLFAYSIDGGPVDIIDIKNGDRLPKPVMAALMDEKVEKHAFNAAFERLCVNRHFGITTPVKSWLCSSVLAASHGLPGNLRLCAAAMKLDVQKMRDGESLIRKFSIVKPDKNGIVQPVFFGGPDWALFKQYCVADVMVEMAIANALKYCPTPPLFENSNYWLDQQINDRGVAIDIQFARTCVALDDVNTAQLESEAIDITGLDNPNSDTQLKKWLSEKIGSPVTSLNKKDVDDIDIGDDPDMIRVMEIRKETRRSSTAKYKTMIRTANTDGRLRGMFRYYGAPRTGRWSSKFVQLQNMPSGEFHGLDRARACVAIGDLELIRMTHDSVSETLSALIRTAMVARPGHVLVCADFSAIEARILAWLANETWRMDVFAGHGKIYEASAAAMFNIPIESIDKGSPYRKKGKVAELACGYGGSVNALINMGALKSGLVESELMPIVKRWRAANPRIVALWRAVGDAALAAVRTGVIQEIKPFGLRFMVREQHGRRWMYVRLPSGRCLAYYDPIIVPGEYGDELSYMKYGNDDGQSIGAAAGAVRVRTYGAKLVENITQAIARDCLAVGMWRVTHAGFPVVMHIHDEIVAEVPAADGDRALESMLARMADPISWSPGLLLGGDGFITPFYRKEP